MNKHNNTGYSVFLIYPIGDHAMKFHEVWREEKQLSKLQNNSKFLYVFWRRWPLLTILNSEALVYIIWDFPVKFQDVWIERFENFKNIKTSLFCLNDNCLHHRSSFCVKFHEVWIEKSFKIVKYIYENRKKRHVCSKT